MSKAHYIVPTGATPIVTTARLGSGAAVNGVPGTGGTMWPGIDDGKLVKLVGESMFDLTTVGDPIEGVITSVEQALSAGFTVGGVVEEADKLFVTADGLQATPGTGTLAIGDYVVSSNQEAKGVARSTPFPKVVKSTVQLGGTPASLAEAGQQIKLGMFAWRVVSLGAGGAGAVGSTITIERVGG